MRTEGIYTYLCDRCSTFFTVVSRFAVSSDCSVKKSVLLDTFPIFPAITAAEQVHADFIATVQKRPTAQGNETTFMDHQ